MALFVCLDCFVALRPKSAMVMAGRTVHLTTLFSWASFNQYFVHILSLVTDINPYWIINRKGDNDRRNYFMINVNETMGPGRIRTCDPWICRQTLICNQTRYWLRYVVRYAWLWHCDIFMKEWHCPGHILTIHRFRVVMGRFVPCS